MTRLTAATVAVALPALAVAACQPNRSVAGAVEQGTPLRAMAMLAAPARPLRVVSYNVHFGKNVERIAAAIETQLRRPDVLLLQEMQHHTREGQSRPRRLADRLGYAFVYAPAVQQHGHTHGLAVLSRHPIIEHQVIPLPLFRVAGTCEPRIALRVTVEIDGQRLDFYDVHLDVVLSVAQRLQQLQPVITDALARPGPVLIGGDFNTFLSQPAALDRAMAERGFIPLASGAGRTHRIVPSRLDAFFARGLAASPATAHRAVTASDHVPLEVRLH